MEGYNVRAAHAHQSGFLRLGRSHIRGVTATGTSNAAALDVFDTDTAPVAGTYARSGATITVTKSSHGLSTGDMVGISFAGGTGGAANPGNFEITVTGANTFTLVGLNSGTISGTPACYYVYSNSDGVAAQWVFSKEMAATDIYANIFQIPGRGLLVRKGIYARMENMASTDIFYE